MGLRQLGFDFIEMTQLAKLDPDEFARRREELICRMIEKSGPSRHLEELQMDIDAVRYSSCPGYDVSERMVKIALASTASMTAHLARLNDLLETSKKLIHGPHNNENS